MGCGSSVKNDSFPLRSEEIEKIDEKNIHTIRTEMNGNVQITNDENQKNSHEINKEMEVNMNEDNSHDENSDKNIKLYELTIHTQTKELKFEVQEHLEEWKCKITEAMESLNEAKDLKNEEVLNSMEKLKKSYFDKKLSSYQPMIGEHLCNVKFPVLFCKFWIELTKSDFFDSEHEQEHKVFKVMKAVAWNYSDASIKICEELGKAGAVPLILTDLARKELLPGALTNQNIYHIKASLGILNNMVRLCPDNIQILRNNNAVQLLLDYTAVSFLILKANCFIILSFLITDKEVNLLENMGSAVRFIIDLFTTSLTSGKARGYSTTEILLSLNNLASNDQNKVKIVDNNGLIQLDRALKKTGKATLILSAMLLWKLAFIEQNRVKIRENESLVGSLKRLKSHKSQKLKEACAGALWEIFEGESNLNSEGTLAPTPSHKGPHVMLSYNWDHQPRIIQLKQRLQNAGYNVWMDIDQMEGDILGAMAAAVENAEVILSCISKKYKDSTSCRTEATYAYKRDKAIIPLIMQKGYEPDGWLGALIGTLKYFPMFDDSKLDTELNAIINEIGERGKTKNIYRVPHKEIVPVHAAIQSSAINKSVDMPDNPTQIDHFNQTQTSLKINKEVLRWTITDVNIWLKEINLGIMKDVDGEILIQMYKMSKEAPDFFYTRLERDFNMKHIMQILRFSNSLEKLMNGDFRFAREDGTLMGGVRSAVAEVTVLALLK